MKLVDEFREIRRVSTPWCLCLTTDYRGIIREFSKVAQEAPLLVWNLVSGHSALNQAGQSAAAGITDTVQAPVLLLDGAKRLPPKSVLFMVVPVQSILDDAGVIQGISNLRDEFKRDGRTLVILGCSLKLPPLLAGDIPILLDSLPDEQGILSIGEKICQGLELDPKKFGDETSLKRAAELCQGLTRFTVEESLSRKIRPKGFDLKGLSELQRTSVEMATNRALTWERSSWKFDAIGGLNAFKDFARRLFGGPKAPTLIVRVDEIEKSINSSSTGAVADSSGTSQDILRTLLVSMEEYSWTGLMAIGGPGTGKTLASICTGNEFGVRTLVLDLGALKGSLVGETEARVRQCMDILYSLGKDRVFFMATANRTDTIPPELQARFALGSWYWNRPTEKELKAIWEIQTAAYGIITNKVLPPHENWLPRDVRNACRVAYLCNASLMEAADMISITGISARTDIEKLEEMAEKNGYLSASTKGPYRRGTKEQGRAISL